MVSLLASRTNARSFPPCLALVFALLLASVSVVPAALAQEIFNADNVQPDVAHFPRPQRHGVDAYGDLGLQLPIMTVPGRGMDFPIAFSYRSGIPLKARASWVGAGFSFDVGSITRDPQGATATRDGFDFDTYNVDVFDPTSSTQEDWQPDAYFLTIPGRGTVQVARSNGTGGGNLLPEAITGQWVTLDRRPWKIEAIMSSGPITIENPYNTTCCTTKRGAVEMNDYETFIVTTEDGTRYVFQASNISLFNGLDWDPVADTFVNVEMYYVSAWRLTAILGPAYDIGENNEHLDPKNVVEESFVVYEPGNWVRFEYDDPGTEFAASSSDGSSPLLVQTRYLTAIETPTHRAEFVRDQGREEEAFKRDGGYNEARVHARLQSITLKSKRTGGVLRSAELEHKSGYVKNLILERIGIATGTGESLSGYEFDYYIGAHFPDGEPYPNSADASADEFGFYKGQNGSTGSWQCSDADLAEVWSLRSIRYPTGGTEVFSYESDQIEAGTTAIEYRRQNAYNLNWTVSEGLYNPVRDCQGGVRVSRVERDAGMGEPPAVTTYQYGGGYVTGIPSGFWSKGYTGRYFSNGSRGKAAVVYEWVQADHGGESGGYGVDGSSRTYYTTPATHPEVAPSTYVRVNTGGSGSTVSIVEGNEAWGFGHAFKTEVYRSGGDLAERSESALDFIKHATPGEVWPQVTDPDFDPYGPVRAELFEVRPRSKTVDTYEAGQAFSVTTEYGYHSQTSLLTRTETHGERLTRIVDQKRAHTLTGGVYDDMRERNVLAPVVLETVSERDVETGARTVLGERATTFIGLGEDPSAGGPPPGSSLRSTDGNDDTEPDGACPLVTTCMLVPHRSYVWQADGPSPSSPPFDAWDRGESPSSAEWVLQSTSLEYDDHGRLVSGVDLTGLQTEYFYGSNAANFTQVSEADYLTGTRWYPENAPEDAFEQAVDYDEAFGLVTSVTDAAGTEVRFSYDAAGRLASEERVTEAGPFAEVRSYAYAFYAGPSVPNRIESASTDGSVSVSFFDGFGRPVQEQTKLDAAGSYVVAATTYDDLDRPVQSYRPYAHVTNGAYDPDFHTHAVDEHGVSRPYAESRYEPDPRERLKASLPPGVSDAALGSRMYYGVESFGVGTVASGPAFRMRARDAAGDEVDAFTDAFGHEVGTVRHFRPATFPIEPARVTGTLAQGASMSDDTTFEVAEQRVVTWEAGWGEPTLDELARHHDCEIDDPGCEPPPPGDITERVRLTVRFYEDGTLVSEEAQSFVEGNQPDTFTGSITCAPGLAYRAELVVTSEMPTAGDITVTGWLELETTPLEGVPAKTAFVRNARGDLLEVRPPNYFAPPTGSSASDWASTYTYDTRGLVLSSTTPDAATVTVRYDAAGRTRTEQDEALRQSGRFRYYEYDAFGRLTVMGERVGDPTQRDLSVSRTRDDYMSTTWREVYEHDREPDPAVLPWSRFQPSAYAGFTHENATGRLAAEFSVSGNTPRAVLYSYDWRGRLERKRVLMDGVGPTAEDFTYRYDDLDRVTARGVSVGSHTLWHFYEYDVRGLLERAYVNTVDQKPPTAAAAYTYHTDGSVDEVRLGEGAGWLYVGDHDYDVRGRLTDLASDGTYVLGDGGWEEAFDDLATGVSEDTGETAWSVDASATDPRPNVGVSSSSGRFTARNLNGEVVWTSEPVDITGGAVEVSVDLRSDGPPDWSTSSADYVRVSYSVDGGSEVLVGEFTGPVVPDAGTSKAVVRAGAIAGSTLRLYVRAYAKGSPDESYNWDDVEVWPDGVLDAAGEPTGGAVALWAEGFEGLPRGALSDTGDTAWDADASATDPAPNFQVAEGLFEIRGTRGELVWTSEPIATSALGNYTVSLQASSFVGNSDVMESDPTLDIYDYLRVFVRVDGGAEQLVAEFDGAIAEGGGSVMSDPLSGSSVEVVVRADATGASERYRWDDVRVATVGAAAGELFTARLAYNADGTIAALEQSTGATASACPAAELGADACAETWRQTFYYDGLKRLARAAYATESTTGFGVPAWAPSPAYDVDGLAYDLNGNLLGLDRSGPDAAAPGLLDALTYEYVPGTNRLASVTDAQTLAWDRDRTARYAYTPNGSLRLVETPDGAGGWQTEMEIETYDHRELPLQVSLPGQDGLVLDYAYASDGQRVQKQVTYELPCATGTCDRYSSERYVRDGAELLAVLDGDGKLLHWNVIGAGVVGRLTPDEGSGSPGSGPGLVAAAEDAVSVATPSILADALAPANHPDGSGGTLVTQAEADQAAASAEASVRQTFVDAVEPAVDAGTGADGSVDATAVGNAHYQATRTPVGQTIYDALVAAGVGAADAQTVAQKAGREAATDGAAEVGQAVSDYDGGASAPAGALVAQYYVRDHLGSVRAVVSEDGRVVEGRDYYPFGLEMPGRVYVSGLETRENYTGHERDAETGQLYAGARYYDAALGRWHVLDPAASVMPGVSPYVYVFNNPIALVDPTGEIPILPLILRAGAGGAADLLMQTTFNYYFGEEGITLSQAIGQVNGWQTARSSAESLIPWRTPGGKFGRAASTAAGDVIVNALHAGSGYSGEQAVQDFAVGFLGDLAGGSLGDLFNRYGQVPVTRGLSRLGLLDAAFGRGGFAKSFSDMTSNERRAFQHSYGRHAAELGLPNWKGSNAQGLLDQFNSAVANIRDNAQSISVRQMMVGVRGSGKPSSVQDVLHFVYTDSNGDKYYYYQTLDGTFISAGRGN